MTSWQNILDHLPTGTGRLNTQNNNKFNDESIHRTFNNNTNTNINEGTYILCSYSNRYSFFL